MVRSRRFEGLRRERVEASPRFVDGGFRNTHGISGPEIEGSRAALIREFVFEGKRRIPTAPLPAIDPRPGWARPADTGLRATWLGHSTVVVEQDGARILTDPVWGLRASPSQLFGPKRFQPIPVAIDALGPIDLVVVSHDHYDHLDHTTIERMRDWDTTFWVPLGVGAHLERWGIAESRIVELDWWDEGHSGPLRIVCTPARHASGRGVLDRNATLWAGWAVLGANNRIFFSGDTGLFDGMRDIGRRLGPFDLTMVEVGAYHALWPDWHSGPEQAVLAHTWLRGDVFMPIHWGLFDLALHGWTEPAERARVAADSRGIAIVIPQPGESFEPAKVQKTLPWWPRNIPWETARQAPIISNATNGRPAKN